MPTQLSTAAVASCCWADTSSPSSSSRFRLPGRDSWGLSLGVSGEADTPLAGGGRGEGCAMFFVGHVSRWAMRPRVALEAGVVAIRDFVDFGRAKKWIRVRRQTFFIRVVRVGGRDSIRRAARKNIQCQLHLMESEMGPILPKRLGRAKDKTQGCQERRLSMGEDCVSIGKYGPEAASQPANQAGPSTAQCSRCLKAKIAPRDLLSSLAPAALHHHGGEDTASLE